MRLSERKTPRFIIIQHSEGPHPSRGTELPFPAPAPFPFPKMIVITFPVSTKGHADKQTDAKKGGGGII